MNLQNKSGFSNSASLGPACREMNLCLIQGFGLPGVEGVLGVAVEERSLPHAGVSEREELHQIIVIHGRIDTDSSDY